MLFALDIIVLGSPLSNNANNYEIVEAANTEYAKFAHGSTYVITDYNKVSANPNFTGSDTRTITIDSEYPHGESERNPYVIDNVDRWNKLAADGATNNNNTVGKFYVLAKDLIFPSSSSTNFTPVNFFKGTFHGLGHTMSGMRIINPTSTVTDTDFALFCIVINAEITDLNAKDFSMSQTITGNRINGAGSIAGGCFSCKILNCHGELTFRRTSGVRAVHAGGVIAGAASSLGDTLTTSEPINVFVYRCSGKLSITAELASEATGASGFRCGGIMGIIGDDTSLKMWNCYGEIYVSIKSNSLFQVSGVLGVVDNSNADINIQNCVGKGEMVTSLSEACGSSDIAYSIGASVVALRGPIDSLTIKNCYGYFSTFWSGNKYYFSALVAFSAGWNVNKFSSTDLYNGYETTSGLLEYSSADYIIADDTDVNGASALWSKAKNGLPSGIWTNSATIGNSYSITTSPLKNSTIKTSGFEIKYLDKKSNGSHTSLGTDTYNYGVSKTLTSKTKDGATYVGYTGSTSNNIADSDIFKILPTNYYGDISLYAVWDVDNAYVTKSVAVSGADTSDTENKKYTVNYGTNKKIRLTANISNSKMSDAVIECEWHNGSDIRSGEFIELSSVADSGKWTLYYKMRSDSAPLWRTADWINVETVEVKVNGIDVKWNRDNFTVNNAFIGMEIGKIGFESEFLDVSNSVMHNGTIEWNGGATSEINVANVTERDGKFYYSTSFTYTPDTNNANYVNYNATTFDIEFEVFKPQLIYNMPGIAPIKVDVEYGRTYNSAFIADEFENAFLAKIAEDDPAYSGVANKVPCFVVNGSKLEIVRFRTEGDSVKVSGNHNYEISFDDKTYTVTFTYVDQNDQTQNHTVNAKYGDLLDTNWLQVPAGYVVREWSYTDSDNKTQIWHFFADGDIPADRVTGNITLSANFVELKLYLQDIEIETRNSYVAQSSITSSNITVKALYYIDNDSNKPYRIPLSLGDGNGTTFSAQVVGSPDYKLHVNFKDVNVSHTYGGNSVNKNVTLNVTPITVDTSGCGFADVTVPYGSDVVATLPQAAIVPGIESVTYEYFDKAFNKLENISDIIGNPNRDVTYTVRTVFVVESPDYSVSNLSVSYTIKSAAEEVYLVWDSNTDLTYNGEVQYPKAKAYRVSDNREITSATIEYSGDTDKSLPGTNYSVTASLGATYNIRSGDETCTFSIVQAILPVPTFTGNIIYNGNAQDVVLNGFDSNIMTFMGDSHATDAGDYSVTVTLSDSNYVFDNGQSYADIDWSISKAPLTIVWDKYKFDSNGSVQHPAINRVDGFQGADSYIAEDFVLTGDDDKSEVGSYEISASIVAGTVWANNYTIRNPKRVYAILPEGLGNVNLITVEWSNTTLTYNNEVQKPTPIIKDMDGNVITDVDLVFGGDFTSSKWAGEYNGSVSAPEGYYIVTGNACEYEIMVNAEGEGENPDNPNPPGPDNPDNPDNPSGGDDDGKGVLDKIKDFINTGFPLWQIATMAVGALLSLIFIIKSIQYGNRKKKAQGEAKKISAKAYGALLPVFATDVVALGLSNKIWSIIAFSVAGFTVLMFAVMLITRRGWKKAELAKENAIEDSEKRKYEAEQRKFEAQNANQIALQEKIAQIGTQSATAESLNIEEILRRQREEMEERYRQELARRDEEQAKRDEAMKLMLANMMGRQQGADGMDMGYSAMDNTDLLVQKVIAGLLPMVQQMIPEPTAYLSAPQNEENEELKALVAEQNETMRCMAEQMNELQNQIADMSHTVLDAEIIPDHSEEIRNLDEKHSAEIEELKNQIADLSQGRLEAEILPDQSEELRDLEERHNAEMQAMSAEMNAKLAEMQSKMDMMSSMSVDELDDEDFDDEEEWDSILDEDDDDFVEAVIIDDNGNVRKTYPNFRMRLKQSSDKNREWYAVIKNMFCSQKGVTYRVYKRVEKIRYQGQVVGVIGIAKRSIKLWLALKPYEYDARRYHHKDVSDKPRFVDVPMYVRITSDRALLRAEELILALFQELNMEARKRYNDRSIQELIFTLKHNRLLTNKQYKSLLCETMHVHDCDVLDDETAEKCIENKHVDSIDDSYIATIKLDDIDLNFQDGNRVTLERLKKVGLVPEDCTGFTVTAGQRLTKPLIIVANDFTLDAVKLITLTGGRAIRLTLV